MIEKNITIITRAMCDRLRDKMLFQISDINCPKIALKKQRSYNYMLNIFEHVKTKWAVNIDEDCFITDSDLLLDLVRYMENNNIDYAGMADGGSDRNRNGNPIVMNAFFNVFNAKTIKEKLTSAGVFASKYEPGSRILNKPDAELDIPNHVRYDKDIEPYYRFFYFLANNGYTPLFLKAEPYETDIHGKDPFSTYLLFNNKKLCIHSWYGRCYDVRLKYNKRIDDIVNHAIGIKNGIIK